MGVNDGVVWRVYHFDQGSLPGLAVGDDVVIDATGSEYAITKPGVGRVATLPVSSWRVEHCPITTKQSNGCIRYDPSGAAPWVSFANRAQKVGVTFHPAPIEALLDPEVARLVEERSLAPSGT